MAIYLVHENNGLIVNAIECATPENYDPGPGLQIIPRGETHAWIEWTWDGEGFTPPQHLLDEGWTWNGTKWVPPERE